MRIRSPKKHASRLDIVIALCPTNSGGVLERIVDVLERNECSISDVRKGADRNWGERVGERTEGDLGCWKAHRVIRIHTIVKRKGKIIDAGEPCPQVQRELRRKDMRVT